MALPSWKGRFTPADSLVKDLAAPEIVKAEKHREGEGPLEKNVFEFVINMNTRIVHRDSERQLHFDSKFEHEEMVLVA